MHDEWCQSNASTRNAEGRGSNPTSISAPSVPYRGQRVAFPPKFFAPQQSGDSHSQGACGRSGSRGYSGSRGRGGLGQGSSTSSGV